MRISEAALAGLAASFGVAACSGGADGAAANDETALAQPAADSRIECALHGAGQFSRECTVEPVGRGTGGLLIVRHPDGGFRRFEVLADKRGLAPADGAEPAQMEWREGGIGLAVGADRYRFPASLIDNAGQ